MKHVRQFFVWLALWAMPLAALADETYFRFEVIFPAELDEITKLISIDDVQDGLVYAYANDEELFAFSRLGYAYEVLPHPGTLIEPRMSRGFEFLESWDSYPTYEAYLAMMRSFADRYPELCELHSVGQSVNGREILFVKISDQVGMQEDEPEVLYSGTMHGDETTGYVLSLRLIDYLLSNYGKDPYVTHLVNELEIWINPLANPDATYRRGNHTVYGARRYNSNWVDLNRNFPDPAAGDHPDGKAWQPETLAMMKLAEDHNFVLSANFHGGAEVVNYPWDTWKRRHADDAWFQSVCHLYADSARANSPSSYMRGFQEGVTNGYDWYRVMGGRQDFYIYFHGGREVTIELSDRKLLEAEKLPAHWDYNREALLIFLAEALRGIRGIVTDAVTGLPLPAMVRVLDHDRDRSEGFTDPDVGDYHRLLLPGTYDLEFRAEGYQPLVIPNVEVIDGPATVLDVSLAK